MITIEPGVVRGTVQAPASKSHTHRAFILGALSGNGAVRGALHSDDTQATLDCLRALGFLVSQYPHEVRVGGHLQAPRAPLDARESGTTLRLLTGTASLLSTDVRLVGSKRLRERPLRPLLDALAPLGVQASQDPDGWTVRGPQRGGTTSLPGAASSQFVSSILLSAPMADGDTTLRVEGAAASRPYVDITLAQLRHHGITVRETGGAFEVQGRQTVRQRPYVVPGDYSSAAFLLAAAAVTRGDLTLQNLPADDPQGDRAIVDHLRAFGARVDAVDGRVRVRADGPLSGIEADVGQTPDLFPVLCALGAVARGRTVLRGAPSLRDKESDRIRAMATNLGAAGIAVQELPDGIEIVGGIPKGISIRSFDDHRVAMACVTMALASAGASNLPDENIVSKSYPNFHNDLRSVTLEVARR